MQKQLSSPMPSSLSNECKKAEKILNSFVNPPRTKKTKDEPELGIPRAILSRAKGLAIFTAMKAGVVGSIRFGSGLIVARLPDGSWSAPSAMATGGIGLGTQLGFELTDFVFVLNSDRAVNTFTQSGSITLGKNLSVALGPYGRSAEISGALSSKGLAGMFAYSKTRGVFGGKSFEGGMIGERPDANKKMYGVTLTAKELLSGKIEPPPDAESLMRLLNSARFKYPTVDDGDVSPMASTAELSSGGTQQEIAELPAHVPDDESKKACEIDSKPPGMIAELDAGPGNEVFELSAGDFDSPKVYELDASQPVSSHASKEGESTSKS
ncbi:hypothetical protein N7532_001772 [Penicillium argentinense]|uniref:Ysc84 actin-binding domain-containing protein n=1 Tax=Penicillium argentinense TaxID=1131581 RepID=A0A9W9G394_9EURO|nr:uncharacterized protein N7532_001772 [Penicillium argentinense]KAJ5111237.1 hypothetical protein N7532_001772 [Penicillium argentinense]